jgi:hypothetical protein
MVPIIPGPFYFDNWKIVVPCLGLTKIDLKNMKRYATFSLVIALFITSVPAFPQSHPTGFAINPKIGIFFGSDYINGIVLGSEFNYLTNGWIFSVDGYVISEVKLLQGGEKAFLQVGFMAGQYYGDGLFRMQVQGGIAPIRRLTENPFSTLGLVLKTGFKIVPARFFSIGLDLQGNINSKKSLIMPLISFEFGRLRPRIDQP